MATDDALIDTGNLEEFLKRVRSYDVDLIYTKGGVDLVHRYTDLAALNGIIGSQDLWLTHARFSNDDEEMTHGLGIAKAVIGEHIARTPPAPSGPICASCWQHSSRRMRRPSTSAASARAATC